MHGAIPFEFVPDCFKIEEVCEGAIEDKAESLGFVPDHFSKKRMCEISVEIYSSTLNLPQIFLRPKGCVKGLLKSGMTTMIIGMMMMMMMMMIMIGFLSGTMGIKTQGPKSTN